MQHTNGQKDVDKREFCQHLIKQAVTIKNARLNDPNRSPHEIMAGALQERLFNLLAVDGKPHLQDWGARLFNLKHLLEQILVLLGKPGVIDLLPDWVRGDASERIQSLVEFFGGIDDDETHALMDLEWLEYNEEEQIDRLIKYYSYDKQYLNERLGSNYFFFHYKIQKERFEEMERFVESNKSI